MHSLISFENKRKKIIIKNTTFLRNMLLVQETSCQTLLICKQCTKRALENVVVLSSGKKKQQQNSRHVILHGDKKCIHATNAQKYSKRCEMKRIYWNLKCKTTNNFLCITAMRMAKILKIIMSTFIVNYSCRYCCM